MHCLDLGWLSVSDTADKSPRALHLIFSSTPIGVGVRDYFSRGYHPLLFRLNPIQGFELAALLFPEVLDGTNVGVIYVFCIVHYFFYNSIQFFCGEVHFCHQVLIRFIEFFLVYKGY
jgi:hypothetical protein